MPTVSGVSVVTPCGIGPRLITVPRPTNEKRPFSTGVSRSFSWLKKSISIRAAPRGRAARHKVVNLDRPPAVVRTQIPLREPERKGGESDRDHGEENPGEPPQPQGSQQKIIDRSDCQHVSRQDDRDDLERNGRDTRGQQELEQTRHCTQGSRVEAGTLIGPTRRPPVSRHSARAPELRRRAAVDLTLEDFGKRPPQGVGVLMAFQEVARSSIQLKSWGEIVDSKLFAEDDNGAPILSSR